MRADACLGFSFTEYESWAVASGICDARRFILIRLAGPVAKGSDAKSALAQQATAQSRPWCVKAMYIAAPRHSN